MANSLISSENIILRLIGVVFQIFDWVWQILLFMITDKDIAIIIINAILFVCSVFCGIYYSKKEQEKIKIIVSFIFSLCSIFMLIVKSLVYKGII